MSTTNTTFQYAAGTLFDDVCRLSAFMTKNLSGPEGSLTDEYIITSDERELYDECLKQTLPNVFEPMLKIGAGYSSDNTNVTIDLSVSVDDERIETLVEDTIATCLKYGILAEYYSVCVNVDLCRIAQNKFAASLALLDKRLFLLKKK